MYDDDDDDDDDIKMQNEEKHKLWREENDNTSILYSLSKNIVKNITKELKQENFQINNPLKHELDVVADCTNHALYLEDFHKSSISFGFSNHKIVFSIGNLNILYEQYALESRLFELKERERVEKETCPFEKEKQKLRWSGPQGIEYLLQELYQINSNINEILDSKLNKNILQYLDENLKENLQHLDENFKTDSQDKYFDSNCYLLLRDLLKNIGDDKFIAEGEQDCYISFITINEHEVIPDFRCCMDYYDYEPDYDYLADCYKDENL